MDLNKIIEYLPLSKESFTNTINKVITIILILILMYAIVKIGNALIDKSVRRHNKMKFSFDERKAKTAGEILKSILRYTVYFFGIISIFELFLGTITVTFAGIGGVAIGFASQSVIKDVINGFFILFEDHFSVGDFIDIDNKAGIVESIELRITKLRDFNGDLHIIPNGQILKVTNHSRGNMRFIVDVNISTDSDIDRAIALINKTCEEFKEKNTNITDGPKVAGISGIVENITTIRVVGMAKPTKQGDCEMLLRKDIKDNLDKNKIGTSPRKIVAVKMEN
jgi:moderate conductance mechanosensitive channel